MTADNKDNEQTESVGDPDRSSDRPWMTWLGPFRIEATLGSGGMGTTYRAYDELMKRTVALKVLHSSLEISARANSFLSAIRAGDPVGFETSMAVLTNQPLWGPAIRARRKFYVEDSAAVFAVVVIWGGWPKHP